MAEPGNMSDLLVNIDVGDLERATAFYCAALGLSIGRRFDDSAVELVGASSAIYLLAKPAGSVASDTTSQRRDYGRHWFGHGFCLIEFLGRGYDEITTRARTP